MSEALGQGYATASTGPQVSPYTSINHLSDVATIAGADAVGRSVQL